MHGHGAEGELLLLRLGELELELAALAAHLGAIQGDSGEIPERYRGDTWEMQGRFWGDIGEMRRTLTSTFHSPLTTKERAASYAPTSGGAKVRRTSLASPGASTLLEAVAERKGVPRKGMSK